MAPPIDEITPFSTLRPNSFPNILYHQYRPSQSPSQTAISFSYGANGHIF